MAAASRQAVSGVGQINKAMSQVDQVTQRNASASEELASTAEEMSSQAESLQHLVAFFRVEGASHEVARPPAARPAAPIAVPRPSPLPYFASHELPVPVKGNGAAHADAEFRHF